jgi:DNA polymerase III sliding clamp (beta) subunit (PCNA family)
MIFASSEDWRKHQIEIQATSENRLHLSTSTGQVWSFTDVAAEVELPGVVVVPAKPFVTFVERSVGERVTLLVGESELKVSTKSSDLRLRLRSEYPAHASTPQFSPRSSATVPSAHIRKIQRILSAASSKDPVLRCVRWGDGHLVACDRYRLSMLDGDYGLETFFLPAPIWSILIDRINEEVMVSTSDRFVEVVTESARYLIAQQSEGFHDISYLVRATSPYDLKFSPKELMTFVRNIEFIDVDTHRIAIHYQGKTTAEIRAKHHTIGTASARLAASGSFRGSLTLPVVTLTNILDHFSSTEVCLMISSKSDSIVIVDKDITHLIQPYP